MKRKVREHFIKILWDRYKCAVPFFSQLFTEQYPLLDHLAIIDLPSEHSGIISLNEILMNIGYRYHGEGYLEQKLNPFHWLREENSQFNSPEESLPQIIIADFKLSNFSPKVKTIIEKYASYSKPIDQIKLNFYNEQIDKQNVAIIPIYVEFLYQHIINKSWPLPTIHEYNIVREENELAAWVLAFGRKVNHFGIPIYLMKNFKSLKEFNDYAQEVGKITLHNEPTIIKGGKHLGIEQSATKGIPSSLTLHDGIITIPNSFLEFVWRYPIKENPKMWIDYYPDFIPQNANFVIESVYQKQITTN